MGARLTRLPQHQDLIFLWNQESMVLGSGGAWVGGPWSFECLGWGNHGSSKWMTSGLEHGLLLPSNERAMLAVTQVSGSWSDNLSLKALRAAKLSRYAELNSVPWRMTVIVFLWFWSKHVLIMKNFQKGRKVQRRKWKQQPVSESDKRVK